MFAETSMLVSLCISYLCLFHMHNSLTILHRSIVIDWHAAQIGIGMHSVMLQF